MMVAELDETDKRILQRLSVGISSYEELARECGITRNTVYRRIANLEKNGIIRRVTRCVPNYEKLNIVSVCVTAKIAQVDQEKALALLREHSRIKFLWRTYGQHDIVMVAFCERGEEGATINGIKSILERFKVTSIETSVGFVWKKIDFTPYVQEPDEVDVTDRSLKEETLLSASADSL